jgi:hypothetical protein
VDRTLLSDAVMRSTVLPLLLFVGLVGLGSGCASGATGFAFESDAGPPDDASTTITLPDDATVPLPPGEDATAFLGAFSDDAPLPSDDSPAIDDSPPAPPFDAGDAGLCVGPLAPGDLTIVELLIESTPGTGDHGEWVEVASTRGCTIDLRGLRGECPTGAKVNTFEVDDDLWIPPLGTFVIADSSDPAVNHALPGALIPWSGEPGDVLRNEGATVTLLLGEVIVDSVTYPTLKLSPGTSTAFPSDCSPALRPNWTSWQPSTASWFPAFHGTPNAPNVDVHCPTEADD